jgi:hypothetical protein
MSEYTDLVKQLQKEYEIKIFTWIWKKRLDDLEAKVVKVLGWRSALLDRRCGQRDRATFLFRIKFRKWTWYV